DGRLPRAVSLRRGLPHSAKRSGARARALHPDPKKKVKGAAAALALALAACGAGAPPPAREATTSGAPGAHVLRVLYDDFGREAPGLEKDWGYAALVAFEGKQILFDSGRNADILAKNAAALAVDFAKIDLVVVSHAHVDHTSGLDAVLKANPKVPLYLPDDGD